MNKKLYPVILLFASVFVLASCVSEEDDIFDQSAAERLNAVSKVYIDRLCDSPGGWVMEYYPYTDNEDMNTGVGYLIMNRFHKNQSVYTLMKNKATRNTVMNDSSAWEVITDMGPVLTYNSYNKCLGRFTDPYDDYILTPGTYDDESGKGLQGDYEFVMVDVPEGGNHIMLKGKKRGVYQRLTRVPVGTDFEQYIDDMNKFRNAYFQSGARWEYTIKDHGNAYRMDRVNGGRPRVYPEGKDSTAYGWYNPYLITYYNNQYHFRFKDTVMVDGNQMEQEYAYDADADKFIGVSNAENTLEGPVPVTYFLENLTAKIARRWEMSKAEADLSDEVKSLREAVVSDFKAIGCTFNSFSFMIKGGKTVLRVQFRQKTSSYSWNYVFDMTQEGDNVVLKYVEGEDETSSKNIEMVPSLKTFVDMLSQTFTVSANTTRFNPSKLVLTSSDSKYRLLFTLYN
ncbi:DUF4302 domain-containing protein [Prevotella sp. E13-17]|uniref:DUF4302 domain-containing protein n=1 Tax=Prevotella sp. E13-17 TaxID=2913616 RepID=UPI001EDBFCD4|nr:DUF4302 domain-containing protein [Prevotella sp. E13-17]UKK51420.1 DUF4302 domain-containing protein [Prevotella sp. E13-17]